MKNLNHKKLSSKIAKPLAHPPLSAESLTGQGFFSFSRLFFRGKNNCHPEFISGALQRGNNAKIFGKMPKHEIPKPVRNDSRVFAFTLAEVLITLVIIGIIAALTIPNLMKKYQTHIYKTAYRQAFSDINNAITMLKAEEDIEPIKEEVNIKRKEIFIKIASKFKAAKTCFNGDNRACWEENGESAVPSSESNNWKGSHTYTPAFIDNSGRAWYMFHNTEPDIIYDYNGPKGPNQLGKDRMRMAIMYDSKTNNWSVTNRGGDRLKKERWCPSGECYYKSWLLNQK